MQQDLASLKTLFRQGNHAEAIAGCEALCAREPGNREALHLCAMMHVMTRGFARALELLLRLHAGEPRNGDVLFNIGMCERELGDFAAAAGHFQAYTAAFPSHPDGWASLADCRLRLGAFGDALKAADRALALDPASVPAWTVRAACQRSAGQAEPALASYTRAIALAPQDAALLLQRGGVYEMLGKADGAAADYQAAVRLAPADEDALKKATTFLLEQDRGQDAIAVCREVLRAQPGNLAARLGAEWLLGQQVPLWHVPMMNDQARNQPYHDGLQAAVKPDSHVFEIGTGSGLLAMMAARFGAASVVTCEAVGLVAQTAQRIVERNGLQDRVKVLAKPSYAVQLGTDLPRKADILVHEIFSSELLGEHVLPALEDAKARLLQPGATILPSAASLMVALVGGEALGKELHVDQAFGFDLGPFNAIHPKKRPIYREDLPRELLSAPVEAFRFDFANADTFPAQSLRLELRATGAGRCWGVVQWIRFELGEGIAFENHPSQPRPVANWQHTIYRFDEPLQLEPGRVVGIRAMHDRSRPWFEHEPG